MIANQDVLDMLNMGVVILDTDLCVQYWNNWMSMHTAIDREKIIGAKLTEVFPNLNNPKFLRSVKSVMTFGNYYFISQRLHRYLIPMKPTGTFPTQFKFMQQSCTTYPIRDEHNSIHQICITIQDVTEMAAYEKILLDINLKDSLTGAYNRRFLATRLSEEFERHRRYSRTLSLLMLDIDYFKKINDAYGHQCGDFILKAMCETIVPILRKVDMLVRFGGEAFCCLLPETDLQAALILAERIRQSIEEKKFHFGDADIRITVSLGVHEFSGNIDSPDTLLRMADEALYKAKEAGRNRIVSI